MSTDKGKARVVPLAPPRTAADWARVIRDDLGGAVESIVAAGRHLAEAKASGVIRHGGWERWCRDEAGLSPAAVRALMAISRNKILSNRQHANDLPPNWTSLYVLSQLPDAQLDVMIRTGRVRADTTREGATALRQTLQPRPAPAPNGTARRLRQVQAEDQAERDERDERDEREARRAARDAIQPLNGRNPSSVATARRMAEERAARERGKRHVPARPVNETQRRHERYLAETQRRADAGDDEALDRLHEAGQPHEHEWICWLCGAARDPDASPGKIRNESEEGE